MQIKSFIQTLILILIISIIGGIYYKYFNINKKIIEEISSTEINKQDQLDKLNEKISNLELKNNELMKKIEKTKDKEISVLNENLLNKSNEEKIEDNKKIVKKKIIEKKFIEKKNEIPKKETKNLVKDVEYTSIDQKGNKFHLLANSGKSNIDNNDILDLINVRGKITSDVRDTIYIVSDFAQYNSVNLNSKFYENVIINYQDKEITCINFDINMETNMAIAYNNVIVTDPKSVMKAGIVEFDLKTKNININPETATEDINVVTTNGTN